MHRLGEEKPVDHILGKRDKGIDILSTRYVEKRCPAIGIHDHIAGFAGVENPAHIHPGFLDRIPQRDINIEHA